MVDFLLSIVGLASLLGACWEFWAFTRPDGVLNGRALSRWCWR
jgi:hypothetical protein